MWFLLLFNFAGKIVAVALEGAPSVVRLLVWFIPDMVLAYHVFSPHAQGLVRSHRRFRTDKREVWLTIDDGPDPVDTPQILTLLAQHQARATFFVIGESAAARPELIADIVGAGHEVAHHTHTHPLASFWCAGPRRLARELDLTLDMLRALGVQPTRFRPPAGLRNLWLSRTLRQRGLTCIGWHLRGLERWHAQPEAVAARVTRDVRGGDILLLHEGPRVPAPVRVHAIRHVLETLDAAGFRCVIPRPDQLI